MLLHCWILLCIRNIPRFGPCLQQYLYQYFFIFCINQSISAIHVALQRTIKKTTAVCLSLKNMWIFTIFSLHSVKPNIKLTTWSEFISNITKSSLHLIESYESKKNIIIIIKQNSKSQQIFKSPACCGKSKCWNQV